MLFHILGARDNVVQAVEKNITVIATTSESSQIRGSLPSDSPSVMIRSTGNSRKRNSRKVLCRRSSSGAEILHPAMRETIEFEYGSSSTGSVWNRFKKDAKLIKQKEGDFLTKRRGSLPVEILTYGLGKVTYMHVRGK